MEQIIIKALQLHYKIEVIKLTPLSGGTNHNASVYQATTSDLVTYFVKLIRNKHQETNSIVEGFLCESGIKHIIAPLKPLSPPKLHHSNDFALFVYPFIEGTNAFTTNLTENQWVELGKTMREIHDINVPETYKSQMRQEGFSPRWRNAVRFQIKQARTIDSHDSLARQMLSYLKEHIQTIHRLLDAAESIAPRLQLNSNMFVLCHADLHGGNILIDAAQNIFIIDWESFVLAPRERDLMFIGGGVGNVWNKPEESRAFYQGYGKVDINFHVLAYYRIERILEDIAIYYERVMDSNISDEDRLIAYDLFKSQFELQGVIDIALNTYAILS